MVFLRFDREIDLFHQNKIIAINGITQIIILIGKRTYAFFHYPKSFFFSQQTFTSHYQKIPLLSPAIKNKLRENYHEKCQDV